MNRVVRDIAEFLKSARMNADLSSAVQDLLQQGVVLVWSATEVLFRDVFESYLNSHPECVTLLQEDPEVCKRFSQFKFSLQTLTDYRFDLSASLGSYLLSINDFSGLPVIRSVYLALFPKSDALRSRLGDRKLWKLSQQRHLIVHRRGIIDTSYVEKVDSSAILGDRLEIDPNQLLGQIELAIDTGAELLVGLCGKIGASE